MKNFYTKGFGTTTRSLIRLVLLTLLMQWAPQACAVDLKYTRGFDSTLQPNFQFINPFWGALFFFKQDFITNLYAFGKTDHPLHPLTFLTHEMFHRATENDLLAPTHTKNAFFTNITPYLAGALGGILWNIQKDQNQSDTVLQNWLQQFPDDLITSQKAALNEQIKRAEKLTKTQQSVINAQPQNLKIAQENLAKARTELFKNKNIEFVRRFGPTKFKASDLRTAITKLYETTQKYSVNNVLLYEKETPFYLLSALASAKSKDKKDLLEFIKGFVDFCGEKPEAVLSDIGLNIIQTRSDLAPKFLKEIYESNYRNNVFTHKEKNLSVLDLLYYASGREAIMQKRFEGSGDCTEMGALELANLILWDPTKEAFNKDLLPQSLRANENVAAFLKNFSTGINESKAREWWYYLFSDKNHTKALSDFDYVRPDIFCELSASSDNIFKALKLFFKSAAQDFKELGNELSSNGSTQVITFDAAEKEITITIKDLNGNLLKKGALSITPHAHTAVKKEGASGDFYEIKEIADNSELDIGQKPLNLFIGYSALSQDDLTALITKQFDKDAFSQVCELYGDKQFANAIPSFETLFDVKTIKPQLPLIYSPADKFITKHPNQPPFSNYVNQFSPEIVLSNISKVSSSNLFNFLKNKNDAEWIKKNAGTILVIAAQKGFSLGENESSFMELLKDAGVNYSDEQNKALDEMIKAKRWSDIQRLIIAGETRGMNPLAYLFKQMSQNKLPRPTLIIILQDLLAPPHDYAYIIAPFFNLALAKKISAHSMTEPLFLHILKANKTLNILSESEIEGRVIWHHPPLKDLTAELTRAPELLIEAVELEILAAKLFKRNQSFEFLKPVFELLIQNKNSETTRALIRAFDEVNKRWPGLAINASVGNQKTLVDLASELYKEGKMESLSAQAFSARIFIEAAHEAHKANALDQNAIIKLLINCPWIENDDVKRSIFKSDQDHADTVANTLIYFDELARKAGYTFNLQTKISHSFFIVAKELLETFDTMLKTIESTGSIPTGETMEEISRFTTIFMGVPQTLLKHKINLIKEGDPIINNDQTVTEMFQRLNTIFFTSPTLNDRKENIKKVMQKPSGALNEIFNRIQNLFN
ncbi:TPA: hypothetical protein DDZ86_05020 [Candidatus Dependentiae bacterium]|nr:MAG: hypothetical protein A2Y17_09825 [Clostridiales bacterium GWF2_38_85]HBL98973.1 hypothetical protein [Candidatus Dependentiae bacterium]